MRAHSDKPHPPVTAAMNAAAPTSRAARRSFARNAERLRSNVLGLPMRPVRACASPQQVVRVLPGQQDRKSTTQLVHDGHYMHMRITWRPLLLAAALLMDGHSVHHTHAIACHVPRLIPLNPLP